MTVIVVFASRRTAHSDAEYSAMAQRMEDLVHDQPGFISMASLRDPESREGVTVAYFVDDEAVRRWRDHAEHAHARDVGRGSFYEEYRVTVATVERDYAWTAELPAGDGPTP